LSWWWLSFCQELREYNEERPHDILGDQTQSNMKRRLAQSFAEILKSKSGVEIGRQQGFFM